MAATSSAPDIATLDIPMDAWTKPFWTAAAGRRLLLPHCGDCMRFRWPSGPFCFECQSQRTSWVAAGRGRIFSYTILHEAPDANGAARFCLPALIEFPDADNIRILAAIVDAQADDAKIGAWVDVDWIVAVNATIPFFRLAPAG